MSVRTRTRGPYHGQRYPISFTDVSAFRDRKVYEVLYSDGTVETKYRKPIIPIPQGYEKSNLSPEDIRLHEIELAKRESNARIQRQRDAVSEEFGGTVFIRTQPLGPPEEDITYDEYQHLTPTEQKAYRRKHGES